MQKKPLTKFITHLWLKLFKKMGIEGTYLNIVQAIYEKHTANIILSGAYSKHYSQWWKSESIPPKIRNKTRVSNFTTVIQHNSGSPSNQRRKRKGIQIGKEEVNLSLFADDMILYIENTKDSVRKLLELINEFIKVAGYKINTQKSLAILYTNNEKSKR